MSDRLFSLDDALFLLDAALRGGAIALLLLTAVIFARLPASRPRSFGIALALCAVMAALQGLPRIPALDGLGLIVDVGGDAAVPAFWLFARAWFDDEFRPSPRTIALVAAFVAAAAYLALQRAALVPPLPALDLILQAAGTGLAVQALWLAWRHRAGDLVEPRRRARTAFVLTVGAIILWTVWSGVIGRWALHTAIANLSGAVALFAGALALALLLFGLRHPAIFPSPAAGDAPRDPATPADLPVDPAVRDGLDRLMRDERAYRDPDLTIGTIAARLGVPDYRVRRLINGTLGHRNVSAFLNDHRIAEVRAALADPAQRDVPILTIAMDAGFGSLAVFNRAFKDRLGETPSTFRRRHLG
jgi:AraC-like DNA-binding protein